TTRLLQCIFFIIPTPPRYTLFPYTTLFRSPVSKMTRQRLSVISVHLHPPYHFLRGLPHRVVEVRAIYGIRRVDRRPGGSAIGDEQAGHGAHTAVAQHPARGVFVHRRQPVGVARRDVDAEPVPAIEEHQRDGRHLVPRVLHGLDVPEDFARGDVLHLEAHAVVVQVAAHSQDRPGDGGAALPMTL